MSHESDVTDAGPLRENELLLAAQREAFRAAMNGLPLAVSLGYLTDTVVARADDGRRCAFYLANDAHARLRHVVGMGEAYAKAVDEFQLSPESLACGLAVANGEPIVTCDVMDDERWQAWTWLARDFGYRACWSFPVETSTGRLVGSFAIYLPSPQRPSARDLELVSSITQAAALITSRHQENEEREREARLREGLRQSEADLARELADTKRLQEVSSHLIEAGSDEALYGRVLDAAMAIMRADCASIQVLEPQSQVLRLLGHKNFHPGSAKFWERVSSSTSSTCGAALREGRRQLQQDLDSFQHGDREAFRLSGLVSVQSTPLTARDGRVIGMLSTHWRTVFTPTDQDFRSFDVLARQTADAFERARAAKEARESEARFQTLVEGIPQLVWRAVDSGSWTWASPQWTKYTGQGTRESERWGWLDAVHPGDRALAREAWRLAIGQGGFEVEYRILNPSDGQYRWFQTRATPVRDEGGTIVEWLGTSTDIHELRELQERQRVMVSELQHRTRNLLGVVRSMSEKTARGSVDLVDFRGRFGDRLEALARVQGLLSRLNERERVTFGELIHLELAAMSGASKKVSLHGPSEIRLRSSTVQTLAMALHELATNALKYGALLQPNGRLAIRWSFEPSGPFDKPWLHIDWRESGVTMPPPGSAPSGSGQGRELIEQALPYQLDARTTFELGTDGVHCTISIPVSDSHIRS